MIDDGNCLLFPLSLGRAKPITEENHTGRDHSRPSTHPFMFSTRCTASVHFMFYKKKNSLNPKVV